MISYYREGSTLDEVICDLLGTCYSVNPAEFTLEEWEELNTQIIECCCCGWWAEVEGCEPFEDYGGVACHRCVEEVDDEEE